MRYGERQRRRSFNPLAVGVMLLLLAGVVFAGLAVAGKLPWQRHTIAPPEPGMVRIWLAARTIPAFATVTAEYLYNPAIGMADFQDLPQDRAPKQLLSGPQGSAEILGRVMARSKLAGQPFVEADFLPKGTLPGMVAGIPPNMRAITLEATNLKGVDSLQVGDHLDLLAALPIDRLLSTGDRDQAWRPGNPLVTNTKPTSSGVHQTETRMIANDAVVVSPLTTHNHPVATNSLVGGAHTRTVPVQEIVLAIDRQDVAGVNEALEMGLTMTCNARSGRPNSADSLTPPPGMVMVPVAARFVLAYSEIAHDDLYDVRTRDLRYVALPVEDVKAQQIVVDAAELFGRVVKTDRTAGQFFREGDLSPRGTPPGLTAGVPPGKRAIAIAADQLEGSAALRHGDHLDLLASIPLSLDKLDKPSPGGAGWLPTGDLAAAALHLEQAEIRVVVHDAVVVASVATPKFTPSSAGMTASKELTKTLEHTNDEIVLAVSADEVAKLDEAVSLGLKLTVASRSGVVADPAAPTSAATAQEKPITEFRPLAKLGTIETMNGAKRQTLLYDGGSGAVVATGGTAVPPAADPVAPAETAPKNAAAIP